MNLVDSCGWLEYFADGPTAAFFARPITDTRRLLVPSICLLEVFKRMFQQRGEDMALEAVAIMQEGHVAELDAATALSAGKISADLGLALADSVILATARLHSAEVWTQDADFNGIQGVRYQAKR